MIMSTHICFISDHLWDQPSYWVEDLISNLQGPASLSGDFRFVAAITLVKIITSRIFEWLMCMLHMHIYSLDLQTPKNLDTVKI